MFGQSFCFFPGSGPGQQGESKVCTLDVCCVSRRDISALLRHLDSTSQWNQKHRGFAPVWLMGLRCGIEMSGESRDVSSADTTHVSRADTRGVPRVPRVLRVPRVPRVPMGVCLFVCVLFVCCLIIYYEPWGMGQDHGQGPDQDR